MGTFAAIWTYSEVTDRIHEADFETEARVFYQEFKSFHDAGSRFTAAEGKALEAGVAANKADLSAHLQHSAKCTEWIIQTRDDTNSMKADILELQR